MSLAPLSIYTSDSQMGPPGVRATFPDPLVYAALYYGTHDGNEPRRVSQETFVVADIKAESTAVLLKPGPLPRQTALRAIAAKSISNERQPFF